MNIKDYKHVYLIGAGGISISAVAKLFLRRKIRVSGFDLSESDITKELSLLGANINTKNQGIDLPGDVDLVVFSEAVPEDNKIREQARRRGILELSGSEFWGEYSQDKRVIAVSGTNGKSTTTAILGLILEKAGLDPTVVVGTRVLQWNSNIRIGRSDLFVIEADEYAAKMLNYTPEVAVVTNIRDDHLDFYKNTQDIIFHFQKWIDSMPRDGSVILNRDDENSKKLKLSGRKKIEFGVSGSFGIRATGITNCSPEKGWTGKTGFNIVGEKDWGYVKIKVPGAHNIVNSLAASSAASCLGVKKKKIIKALSEFKGTWRRFELVGEYNKALVVSDYAHHPEGIRATIQAAREWYPFNRMVVLFQPHQRNRTKNLFDEFAQSFEGVDQLIISEIFDVAGREAKEEKNISSKNLVQVIREKKSCDNAIYAENLQTSESLLKNMVKSGDIVLIMGAGKVDDVARNLSSNHTLDTK